jgi:hypothetical protein
VQRELETPLSKRLLKGDVKTGQTVVVGFNPEDGITFEMEETAIAEAQSVGVEA